MVYFSKVPVKRTMRSIFDLADYLLLKYLTKIFRWRRKSIGV